MGRKVGRKRVRLGKAVTSIQISVKLKVALENLQTDFIQPNDTYEEKIIQLLSSANKASVYEQMVKDAIDEYKAARKVAKMRGAPRGFSATDYKGNLHDILVELGLVSEFGVEV